MVWIKYAIKICTPKSRISDIEKVKVLGFIRGEVPFRPNFFSVKLWHLEHHGFERFSSRAFRKVYTLGVFHEVFGEMSHAWAL